MQSKHEKQQLPSCLAERKIRVHLIFGRGWGQRSVRQSTTASRLQHARNTAGGCPSVACKHPPANCSPSFGSETHVAARSFVALYRAVAHNAVRLLEFGRAGLPLPTESADSPSLNRCRPQVMRRPRMALSASSDLNLGAKPRPAIEPTGYANLYCDSPSFRIH